MFFKENSLQDIKNKISNFHDATIDIEEEQSLKFFYTLISKTGILMIRLTILTNNQDYERYKAQFYGRT